MMNLRSFLVFCAVCVLVKVCNAQVYNSNLHKFGSHHGLMSAWWWQATASNLSLSQTNTSHSRFLVEGFSCLGLSVIGFGSALVPIKRLDTEDGMFFQFVFCSTQALESLLVYVIRGCPDIWAFSIVGGFLFALGNFTTVPIIKTIGLGMGFLIWSVFSLLTAWASARFGWFGLDRQDVPNPTLNYIGTALTTISVLPLFFIKTEKDKEESQVEDEERKPLLHRNGINSNQLDSPVNDYVESENLNCQTCWTVRLSPMTKKIIGCLLAALAGMLYGCSYTPIIYIKNNSLKNGTSFPGASQFDLDYIFPYMTGTNSLTSMVFFGYCIAMKNRPALPSKCVVPAFCGASLQFASQCAFFAACYRLGTLITFPIGSTGPAFISLIWSVFYFKEIKGTKNFLILTAVLVTVLSGVTLISLSKI